MTSVLVVDDNPLIRALLRRLLEEHGLTVHTADDGAQGLRAHQRHLPDLVIMDLSMRGMDGFTAIRALRANQQKARLNIIALSAGADPGDKQRGLTAGADRVLVKPVVETALLEEIAILLESRGAAFGEPSGVRRLSLIHI